MSNSGKLELHTYIYHHARVGALVSLAQFWFMHCPVSISYDPIWLAGEQRIGKREHKRKVCAFDMSLGVVSMNVHHRVDKTDSHFQYFQVTLEDTHVFVFCGAYHI